MTDAGPSTSLTLVDRIRRQDSSAWTTFVEIYFPLIYARCRRGGLDEHDAADVVQEVFRAALLNMTKFRHDRPGDSFRRWLFGITRHKLQDFWREQQKREHASGGTAGWDQISSMPWPDDVDDSSSLRQEELALVARRALEIVRAEVHEQTWQAAWRVLVLGETVAEAAERLQLTTNAVYKARARVLQRMRDTLTGLGLMPDSTPLHEEPPS